jgi:hypothetical protein
VESESFESASPDQKYHLDSGSLYLAVRRKRGRVSGRVQDSDGNALAGVEIYLAGVSTATDKSGHFELIIPGDHSTEELDLEAVTPG